MLLTILKQVFIYLVTVDGVCVFCKTFLSLSRVSLDSFQLFDFLLLTGG